MAWTELARHRKGKLWHDGAQRALTSFTGSSIHYESTLDSGHYDTPVDMTPVRVNNAQFDGWRVTNNGWHYALGIDKVNHPGEDGWIGFAGRKGQHYFKFRLERVLYVHWPTRAWDDIGGLATYTRAGNLTRTVRSRDIGLGETLDLGLTTIWRDLWNTPGGGEGWVEWRANGSKLKELIFVNQEAREWIAANHPPDTPLAETYFGFAFRLDYTDIPRRYLGDVLSDKDDDIEDSDKISFKTALDELLFTLRIDKCWVEDSATGVPIDGSTLQLKKRLYTEGGEYYLLVGQRVDLLDDLPDGTLVFDPTVDDSTGATNEDAHQRQSGGSFDFDNGFLNVVSHTTANNAWLSGLHFIPAGGPTNGDTIDVAYMTVQCNSAGTEDSVDVEISFEDVDNASNFEVTGDVNALARTTATASWTATGLGTSPVNTPSLVTPLQEVIDRAGYASGNGINGIIRGRTDIDSHNGALESNEGGFSSSLHIEWTAAPTGGLSGLLLMGVG